MACAPCRKCVQLTDRVYLWHTVPTNYRLPDPRARVNAVATPCFSIHNVYVYTQTLYIDMVLVCAFSYMSGWRNLQRERKGVSGGKDRAGRERRGHEVVRGRWAPPPTEGKGARKGQGSVARGQQAPPASDSNPPSRCHAPPLPPPVYTVTATLSFDVVMFCRGCNNNNNNNNNVFPARPLSFTSDGRPG